MAPSAESSIAVPTGDHCLGGNIHTGTTRGKIEVIEEAPTYITRPHPGKGNGNIIFYYPDVHGLYNNALLLMDGFADAGYTVFGIDYFRDDPIWKHRKDKDDTTTDPAFNHAQWREKHSTFALSTVLKWTKTISSIHGTPTTKYACVGYCFGAPYVLDSLSSSAEKTFISAGAFAHPSALTDQHFKNLAKPLLLSCAENDHAFPAEKRNRAQLLLQEGGKKYQVQLFQGVGHGFAVRCDLENRYEKFVKEQSFRGIVEWFDFWLT